MPFELVGPLVALFAYLVFVWWLWRERGWMSSTSSTREDARAGQGHDDLRERVLFVCTHNSARSQMAEALLRRAAGSRFVVESAGMAPTRINPVVEQVMAEHGLSLRSQRAKSLTEVGTHWDYVITLCDTAFEQCPDFSLKTCRLHWSIEDPAAATGAPSEQLLAFRRVRDDLSARIARWLSDRLERL
jgi:arsenate reductase